MTDISQELRNVQRLLREANSTGDLLQLVAHGCSEVLLQYLRQEEDLPPYLRLFRAALAKRGIDDGRVLIVISASVSWIKLK